MIGVGHVCPIASAQGNRIAAGLEKNSPLIREVIDRRVRASNRRATRQARFRQAKFFAKLAVRLALSEALNHADLAADRECFC